MAYQNNKNVETKDNHLKNAFIPLLVTIIGGVLVVVIEHYLFNSRIVDHPKPNPILTDTSIKPPYPPIDVAPTSCLFDALKNVDDDNEIETQVRLNGKYSEGYTVLFIKTLEKKIDRLLAGKRIVFNSPKDKTSNSSFLKKNLLNLNLEISFKPTNETTSMSKLKDSKLITGKAVASCSILDAREKNKMTDCPIFRTLAGTDQQEITHKLIETIFEQI